jgi:Fur family transcriptional regulator, peroxide stress response regulator
MSLYMMTGSDFLDHSYEFLSEKLKKKNIKLSHQRLKILEYLCRTPIHPTVDQINNDLHKDIHTISKTTIYNTLNTLVTAGLVRVINMEDNEIRYDMTMENHGHFKCESFVLINDFKLDFDNLSTNKLAGYKINDSNVYFKGICPGCLLNIYNQMKGD